MSSERAKKYAELLRNAANIPIEVDDNVPLRLPDYVDHEKIRRAQHVFRENFFAIFYSMYLGLVAILAIPSILNILIHTKGSSTNFTAYRRYMQTIFHTLSWFRSDLKPGTRAWESIESVRKMHLISNRSAHSAKVGIISQKDLAITLFGFMGFTIVTKEKVGLHATEQDIDDYCHFFRVLGYLTGIKDEYNVCCDTMEETYERLEVIKSEFLRPALESPPKEFPEMTRFVANGMWCFNPRDTYDVMIFTMKRLVGVPNYWYTEDEIPKGCDRSKMELYKLGNYARFMNWFVAFIHEYLLQFTIFRMFFNMQTLFHEFLITTFPFLAIYSFGWNRAWITILNDDKKRK